MARPGVRNHPKFRRLKQILKMSAVYVQAHLEAMWAVGYEDGNPFIGDETDVELAAEWEDSGRQPGEWFKAVLQTNWIDQVDGGYQIHDLLENAPEYVKKRAKRHRERRNKDLRQETADNGGKRQTTAPTSDWQDGDGRTPAPAPAPAPVRENKGDEKIVDVTPRPMAELLESPEALSQEFAILYVGGHDKSRQHDFHTGGMAELIRHGFPVRAIRNRINDKQRDRTESFTMFAKWFQPPTRAAPTTKERHVPDRETTKREQDALEASARK